MELLHAITSHFSHVKQRSCRPLPLAVFFLAGLFLIYGNKESRAGTLPDHLKRLTSALSNRNLDSLRLLIDPNKIFVEITPKEGSFLSASQTLGVIEAFFHLHPPISF